MDKPKTCTLRIEADTPEQANSLTVNGIQMLLEKLKSERRLFKKYILSCNFNLRDSAIIDTTCDAYKRLIDTAEIVIGFEAQEVLLTASQVLTDDFEKTYTIDIMFFLH